MNFDTNEIAERCERDGVAIIRDFIPRALLERIRTRLDELNRSERAAGAAFLESEGANQRVFNLVNKGEVVEEIVRTFPDLPVQVGGGIRGEQTIQPYLDCGVRFVILRTKRVNAPHFVSGACAAISGHILLGLGARDILRLEAGLLLHGSDMNDTVNPIEAGLQRFVHPSGDFCGAEPIKKAVTDGPRRYLVGFRTVERGPVPRSHMRILSDGKPVGEGRPGPLTRRIQELYAQLADRRAKTPISRYN